MSCVVSFSSENANELISLLINTSLAQPNEKSLQFFQKIQEKNTNIIGMLPDKFKRNSMQLKKYIHADHIDLVIASLSQQMELPHNISSSIDAFLTDHTIPDMQHILLQLTIEAQNAYSSEVITRTFHILDNLKLLNHKNIRNQLLRSIITSIIYLNEFYKANSEINPNEELINKTQHITSSILNCFGICEKTTMHKLVSFLVDRIILLGIGSIVNPVRTIDLAELYFIFEDLAKAAGLQVLHESNRAFIIEVNAIMLTFGVCKKNPAALYDLVILQQQNHELSTVTKLKEYYSHKSLVLEKFFSSTHFQRYFGKKETLNTLNQQAFLMSLSTQLVYTSEKLMDYIATAQKYRKSKTDHQFLSWFENTADEITEEIKRIFLDKIEEHMTNNLSQVGRLVFAANKLISLGFQPRSITVAATGLFQPLISPEVLRTEVKNLKGMNVFLNQLNIIQKEEFIRELLLAIIIQSNTIQHSAVKPLKLVSKPLSTRSYRKNNKLKRAKNHYGTRFFPDDENIRKHRGIFKPTPLTS